VNPALVKEFRWMLEEYRVSVFAQELGTRRTVSPKRLQGMLDRIDADSREAETS